MSASDLKAEIINFYEELSLSSEFSTAEIREKLEEQRYQWQARASRAGSQSVRARKKLELIAQAEAIFADDDSREEYDLNLARSRMGSKEEPDAEIDWLGRAWSYYFMDDEGAAFVASRKAREQDSQSPLSFVISAWVALKQEEIRQAKAFADEAFVLDELGEDTADVHHVRGVVFYCSRDYEKALSSYDRALKSTGGAEAAEINWRKILVHIDTGNYQAGVELLEAALSSHEELSAISRQRHFHTCAQVAALHAGKQFDSAAIKRYDALIGQAERFDIESGVKSSFIAELKAQRNLVKRKIDLEDEKRVQEQIKKPEKALPDFPVKSLGLGSLFFVIFLASQSGLFFLMAAAAFAFSGYVFYSRSDWNTRMANHKNALERISRIEREIEGLEANMYAICNGNRLAA